MAEKSIFKKPLIALSFAFILTILTCGANVLASSDTNPTGQSGPATTYITLENGMEFALIENRSNPMIASVIVVKTGSGNENAGNNGVSHMLEHLLFNGTTNRSQEELYDQMDFYGGYNNAHTSKDFTNFMILMPAEHIDKGLDIQSDMLFNSTIPENKLEKERGIVIEEIGRDVDKGNYINKLFFESKLFDGAGYALPVLGTIETIQRMPRADIMEYYKKYYVPNNMAGMIIGDFDTLEMADKVKNYFGRFPAGELPDRKKLSSSLTSKSKIYRVKKPVASRHLSIGIKAPSLDDKDFFPFLIMEALINSNEYLKPDQKTEAKKSAAGHGSAPDHSSIHGGHHKNSANSGVNHIYSEYVYTRGAGFLNIFAVLSHGADVDKTLNDVLENLKAIPKKLNITNEEIKGAKTQIKTAEFFMKERMHYYGMSKAHLLANKGYKFIDAYIDNIEKVSIKEIKRVAQKYFSIDVAHFYRQTGKQDKPGFVATIVEPLDKANGNKAEHPKLGGTDKAAKKDKEVAASTTTKQTLSNGLTLLTNVNNDSKVFGAHALFKDRSFHEPEGKTGITDFMHRLLLRGAAGKSEKEIENALNSIGARVAFSDDPYIPYDDYRTSTQHSFIRLETIDDFYTQGLNLLADIILRPDFEPAHIEETRKYMINAIKGEDNSASTTAKRLFYENLMPGQSMSKRILGNVSSISSITRDDLINFHKKYFAPNNILISIVSSIPRKTLTDKVKELFGNASEYKGLKQPGKIELKKLSDVEQTKAVIGKEQANIYLGYPVSNFDLKDDAPLYVLSSILSSDMAFRLREQQGLAYSIGSAFITYKDFGWFQARLGTRKMNIEIAKQRILNLLAEYQTREFDLKEIQKTVNKIKGRMMMRRLPRINQAYYAVINEFYRDDFQYDKKFLNELSLVTPDDIKKMAAKYLQNKDYLCVVVE